MKESQIVPKCFHRQVKRLFETLALCPNLARYVETLGNVQLLLRNLKKLMLTTVLFSVKSCGNALDCPQAPSIITPSRIMSLMASRIALTYRNAPGHETGLLLLRYSRRFTKAVLTSQTWK